MFIKFGILNIKKKKSFNLCIEECNIILSIEKDHIKSLFRRSNAYELLNKYEESLIDLKKLVELDPTNKNFAISLQRVSDLKQKQQKEEMDKMLGQLKDLGNKFLNYFGLSTDNFQFNNNDSGGYSMNFNK
jgi:tetratricopeptide (TPR) repeat protein